MIRIHWDKTGRIFSSFSIDYWRRWINSFVKEKSYLSPQHHLRIHEEAEWVLNELERIRRRELFKVLAIDEEKNEVVGVCDVQRKTPLSPYGHNVDFGLAVHRNYRRQGWGRRLLSEGLRVAREVFRAKNIWIEVVDGNEPAIRLYKKMGFKEVCRLEKYHNYFGELRDIIVMKLPMRD